MVEKIAPTFQSVGHDMQFYLTISCARISYLFFKKTRKVELIQQGNLLNYHVRDNRLILDPFLISTFHGVLVCVQI
jgi:hypothetical protein